MDSKQSFRTEIKIKPFESRIDHKSRLITIGSCFSNSIGERLNSNKFEALVNPFGTVFNPISIFKLLSGQAINENGLVEHDGLYFHHDFHSEFRSTDQGDLLSELKSQCTLVSSAIKVADFIIITLGTAYVYEQVSSDAIVNNCHKVAQSQFKKRLLSLEEMEDSFKSLKQHLHSTNPGLKLVFTVSPVRHIKDGVANSNLSKSLLRVFCDRVSDDKEVLYFSSYEILMDDLRDYRFYSDDLLHPTSKAEDYIWEKFSNAFMSNDTLGLIDNWRSIRSSLRHRPFNPSSEAHQSFLRKLKESLIDLSESLELDHEINEVLKQIEGQ